MSLDDCIWFLNGIGFLFDLLRRCHLHQHVGLEVMSSRVLSCPTGTPVPRGSQTVWGCYKSLRGGTESFRGRSGGLGHPALLCFTHCSPRPCGFLFISKLFGFRQEPLWKRGFCTHPLSALFSATETVDFLGQILSNDGGLGCLQEKLRCCEPGEPGSRPKASPGSCILLGVTKGLEASLGAAVIRGLGSVLTSKTSGCSVPGYHAMP